MRRINYYVAQRKDLVINFTIMSLIDFIDIFPFSDSTSVKHWSVVFSRTDTGEGEDYFTFRNLVILISDVDFGSTVLVNNHKSRPIIFRKVKKKEMLFSSDNKLEVMPIKWHCPFYSDIPLSEIKAIFKYFLEEK